MKSAPVAGTIIRRRSEDLIATTEHIGAHLKRVLDLDKAASEVRSLTQWYGREETSAHAGIALEQKTGSFYIAAPAARLVRKGSNFESLFCGLSPPVLPRPRRAHGYTF
jgi:hypothetical protein